MPEVFKTPEISYTSRDYESIRDDMIRAIPFFTPEWTNHNPSDFGIAIVELLAYGLDVLHYYCDAQMLECFLKTAKKRESVSLLLGLIDYKLGTAIPATVDLLFTLPDVFAVDVLIPMGTELQTISDTGIEPVLFETVEDLTIPIGMVTGTVGAIEGITKTEILGTSDGTELQRIEIPIDRVVEDSILLEIDEGAGFVEWEKFDSLIESEATDRHYFTEVTGTPEHFVLNFGDNIQGKIPTPGATIRVTVRVLTVSRGGANGNVGAETILVVNSTITVLSSTIAVSVVNELAASGGEPPETIEHAKLNGPKSLNALNRAVTEEDFEILTKNFPGIALANAIPIESSTSGCCGVCIVIYPEGGGVASSVLKEELLLCLNQKKMVGTFIEIKDACEKKINIEGIIYLRDNFQQDSAKKCVDDEINNFFEIGTGPIDIGRNINISDIYPLIMNCFDDGVSYANITKLTIQPEATLNLWSGDTVFEYIEQKSESENENWTIIFNSPTTFRVTGSISGLQANVGSVGSNYLTDNANKLALKIITDPEVATPSPNVTGDFATFSTSPILGNVEIDETCVAIKGNVLFQYIGGAKTKIKC